MLAVAWLGAIALCAITADLLPLHPPGEASYDHLSEGPSSQFLLGTDQLGRDLLSRIIYGARISLVVGVLAVGVGLVFGGFLGLIAGYFRGRAEAVITILADATLAFPGLVLLLAIAAAMGASLRNIVIALGILSVPPFIRLSRAYTLQYAQLPFVIAAKSMGARHRRILFRELLPNILPSLGAYSFLIIAIIIVAEGSLSFLGVGIPPPSISWGAMISGGRERLANSPHISAMPSIAMFFTVLSLNLIGDRMRGRLETRESNL